MKRYIYALIMASVVLYTSCLGSSNESSGTTYNDMAITSFKLTTVNRHVHTTGKSGQDSVYTKTLSNPAVFTIDQQTHNIYNTDSLPYGSDTKHVLATITSKNNGEILIKSLISDTLFWYSSTDSIDFSEPRHILVYAYDGSGYRDYTVTVNVHQVDNSKILWEQKDISDMPISGLEAWWGNKVFEAGLKEFIGAGREEAYAFSEDGTLMVSKDEGENWVPDSIGDDPSMLPTANVAFVSVPFTVNDSTDYQLMVGTNPNDPVNCVIWRKIAEYASSSIPSKWVNIPVESNNLYALPYQENLNLVSYNGLILAIGDDGNIYQSNDLGLTWETDEAYTLPEGLTSDNLTVKTFGDDYIWIVDNDTGEVWRGIKIE